MRITVPERLDLAGLSELEAQLTRATTEVVVLEGTPGRFCLGMDNRCEPEVADLERFAALLERLHRLPSPTLAAVDGAALGGGVGLAAACDVVLATDRATFGLPEVLLGLVPAIIWPYLAERTGPQRARRMALVGRSHPASEAMALGLVDDWVEQGKLESRVKRWSRELSRAHGPAVALLKDHAARVQGLPTREAAGAGVGLTHRCLRDPRVLRAAEALARGEAPWEMA